METDVRGAVFMVKGGKEENVIIILLLSATARSNVVWRDILHTLLRTRGDLGSHFYIITHWSSSENL